VPIIVAAATATAAAAAAAAVPVTHRSNCHAALLGIFSTCERDTCGTAAAAEVAAAAAVMTWNVEAAAAQVIRPLAKGWLRPSSTQAATTRPVAAGGEAPPAGLPLCPPPGTLTRMTVRGVASTPQAQAQAIAGRGYACWIHFFRDVWP
jgi:hypothetical protein